MEKMTSILRESNERNKNIKGMHIYTNEIIIGKSFLKNEDEHSEKRYSILQFLKEKNSNKFEKDNMK